METESGADLAAFNDTNQENSRKLFVGGLSWETTSDSLRAYMSKYGEVVDCSVKVDVSTGRSRGFGFVMFKTTEEADAVLKTRPHMLDGKIIDPKRAVGISKSGLPITKKIFVGGVRSETTDDSLKEYFTQYGSVHSLDFPIDHTTSKRRGFCFLEFDEPEAAEKAMAQNFHSIGNQTVEVKPAYTKEQQQALQARGMWPPIEGKAGGFSMDLSSGVEPSAQMAFKNLLGQISGNDTQMNNMAAAALFYQTYFQYALALGAQANVSNQLNGVPQTNSREDSKNKYNQEIRSSKENKNSDDKYSQSDENKSRSPERKQRDLSPRRRSPIRRNFDPNRRRRRSSSSENHRRRRRTKSPVSRLSRRRR